MSGFLQRLLGSLVRPVAEASASSGL